MASIYFMDANAEDIDPGTRAVKNIDYRSPPPLFQRDPGTTNVTATQLSQMRSNQPVEEEEDDSPDVATPRDIESEIGEAPIPATTSAPPASQPETTPTPEEEWKPDISDIDIFDFGEEETGIPKTMKNTLNSLIKIAEEFGVKHLVAKNFTTTSTNIDLVSL